MKDNAIKEIYKNICQDVISQCNQSDALKIQELEMKFDKKISMLADKANSEETKTVIKEINCIHEELTKNLKEVSFVLGFKKGAQIMGLINE